MPDERSAASHETMEIATIETKEVSMSRTPDVVLGEAKRAAESLKAIIAKKPKPVIIAGRQFLEFEDWAMIAKFYGVVAKVVDSKYVEYGTSKGFESVAVAFHIHSGQEISRAVGMCMSDEEITQGKTRADWSLQRLRSFSQTRACSKCLKQVFSWVAVLGGYAPQPAEEMTHEATTIHPQNHPQNPHEPEVLPPIKEIAADIKDMIGVMCQGDQTKMEVMLKEFTSWKDKESGQEKWLDFDSVNRLVANPSKHAWLRKIHSRVSEFVANNKGKPQ
jgi:hypothetical protein